MNELTRHLAPTFLVAAVFLTVAAYAMEIQQFDRMADQDQGAYVVLLVQDAEKVLHDEGRPTLRPRWITCLQPKILAMRTVLSVEELS